MNTTKTEALAAVDQQLSAAGMPTYSEVVALLKEAQRLGLQFDCGNAYIRRIYIDRQDALNARIKRVKDAMPESA